MNNLNFVRLDDRCVLKVSGDEARDFLQGLVSNDLDRVSETRAIYAALLTPQGKYLHDFFIAELAESFYLDCEASRIDDLFKRLRMYKMRSKVELEIVDDMAVAVFFGSYIHDALSIKKEAGSAFVWLGGVLYTDPRLTGIGARAMIPTDSFEIALRDEGFSAASFEDYDELRLSLGLPDSSRDLEIDKSILLESGFEELNGVDFDKGCYMGQELTARTKHRGLIKKRLIPVTYEGSAPAPGTEITQAGKNAGETRSAAGSTGLALIRLEVLENSEPLMAGDSVVTPNKPDWANF
jgi:folate-binding protein YgfZ